MLKYRMNMRELYLLRPDAISALQDEIVVGILPNYIKIINNQTEAKFQANKSSLNSKISKAKKIVQSCELCERKCGVNRLKNEKGECRVAKHPLISSEFVHVGEEPFFVPSHTIFFMGCNFHCQYCQNWTISQWQESGFKIEPEQLASMIDRRRNEGCRNVNFVGGEPTPNLLFILETLNHVTANVPVVWNSNFYMTEKTMKVLGGVVDVYLSDFKYGNDKCAQKLSKVENYMEVVERNHEIATKQAELVIRHLVLPNHLECCTKPILEWIANNIQGKCIVNLMNQYRPAYKAHEYSDINRRLDKEEFDKAVELAKELKINYTT